MNVIQLGPLILNFEMLIFILSAFTGYLALKYRLGKAAVEGNISDKFGNALILGFVTWKCSIIIFDPVSVIQYPMSLVYFNGGDKGLWLAVIISLLYLWIRTRKDGTSIMMNLDVLCAGWIVGSSMYHLLLLIVDRESLLFHILYVVVNVVLGLFFYSKKESVGSPVVINRLVIWYSLGMIAITFFEKGRTLFVYGFTKEQLIFMILFILFLFMDSALDKGKRKF
ncbi:hypothetical protein ACP8HI_09345 [Paenibacillus sp. FA6]|uniref:hypothetical protein n=1 Tax=Paenibacillus sp. FA6 TaxID=3413029 RepID=UPI003F65676E